MVPGELGSLKFGFQVDSQLAVVADKVQAQHKVHLPGAFPLSAVVAQLSAPSNQLKGAEGLRWQKQRGGHSRRRLPTLSGKQN